MQKKEIENSQLVTIFEIGMYLKIKKVIEYKKHPLAKETMYKVKWIEAYVFAVKKDTIETTAGVYLKSVTAYLSGQQTLIF